MTIYNKTYKDSEGNWRSTKEYALWHSMMFRCKLGSKVQYKRPTYLSCTVSETFQDFQQFAAWCQGQIGFGQPGYQLDKDILFEGNKEYSEDVCVFVPAALNSFLITCAAARGELPLGVCWDESAGKYLTNISIDGKKKHLGYFTTPTAAHATYIVAKEAEAKRWYKRLHGVEFLVDPRVTERMRTWEVVS